MLLTCYSLLCMLLPPPRKPACQKGRIKIEFINKIPTPSLGFQHQFGLQEAFLFQQTLNLLREVNLTHLDAVLQRALVALHTLAKRKAWRSRVGLSTKLLFFIASRMGLLPLYLVNVSLDILCGKLSCSFTTRVSLSSAGKLIASLTVTWKHFDSVLGTAAWR